MYHHRDREGREMTYFDTLETRTADERAEAISGDLPRQIAAAKALPPP